MKTIGLIPARGGSKGIPRKNIKPLLGRPLIEWTIKSALEAGVLDGVVVTTDDEEIADTARSAGADVPFIRPAEISKDETPGIDPVLHALDQLPSYDHVLLLQPTSPLRTALDIRECLRIAQEEQSPSIVSVCTVDVHPFWMYGIGRDQKMHRYIEHEPVTRRQDLPPVYALNGALYFASREWLREKRTFVDSGTRALVMPRERSIDIDVQADWLLAEIMLKERV